MRILLCCLPLFLFAAQPIEEEGVRRVQAHLLIDDAASALKEAEALLEAFPESKAVGTAYVQACAANRLEERALQAWNRLAGRYPDLMRERNLLEDLAWGVLKKGVESTQYGVRLAALIGSYLTQDVRAVPILQKMMRDSNVVIRSVAVRMASSFRDAPLKDEIARMMVEEKVWLVRLEVIKSIGSLRMKNMAGKLKTIIASEKNSIEERQLAIQALINMYDQLSWEEFKALAKSNRSGMRHLACEAAAHFKLKEAKDDIVRLMKDSHPDVRVAALNALGLFYREEMELADVREALSDPLEDTNPAVAITASWVAILVDPSIGEAHLAKWLNNEYAENRRLAAAALSATGNRCIALARETIEKSADPFVRTNIALGLIGQRIEVKRCCDIIYDFLTNEKKMWMWDERTNPLFQVLSPSQVRHIDQIPNYPDAIDQMTRLNLVSLLALVEDPRAQEALKSFLQYKTWGITGVAAATLLQEGDSSAMEIVRSLVDDPDPNVRLQACLVLAMLGHDESVFRDLQKAYIHSDHERKLHILEALGKIGSEESFSFFVGVLQEPFPILRVAAAAGLLQGLNR